MTRTGKSVKTGMANVIFKPCPMRSTRTDKVYNVTSGSSAPQSPVPEISELQMLLIVLRHETSNNISKNLGLKIKNDQIIGLDQKMIR